MLDFRIETFLLLCKTLNYTKTSEILNITQPTVTGHIKYLEKLYNCKLFDYNGKKLSLTKKGSLLYDFALQMRANSVLIDKKMKSVNDEKVHLNIGATKTIGDYVLPKIISNYLKQNPQSEVNIVVDNTEKLLELLDNGEINFAFLEGFFDKSKYDYELLKNEKFVGICSKNNPLATKKVILEELFDERIILREEGSGTRKILEQVLKERSFSINNFSKKLTVSNFSAIKELVENDNGITFLYLPVATKEIAENSLCVMDIEGFSITREFNFVCLKNSLFRDYYKIY